MNDLEGVKQNPGNRKENFKIMELMESIKLQNSIKLLS